jgi:hypothetical protein
MTLQASFAQSALALGRRFRRLNVALLKNTTDCESSLLGFHGNVENFSRMFSF